MILHAEISKEDLRQMIKDGRVVLGGNLRLKIYGKLHCASGKRMKRENRVFFSNEAEAIEAGFRRCKKC